MNNREFKIFILTALGIVWGGALIGSGVTVGFALGVTIGAMLLILLRRLDRLWTI